ncbi:MAG: acriflavine resistance protein, partial [Lacunisphaera sp.]|nr:acriflavine resistance protein [Lacunisphaera sp.]
GLVSLTLTPMLCSRFLKAHEEKHGRIYQLSERVFAGMLHLYDRGLQFCMRHRLMTLGSAALSVVLTAIVFLQLPQGFIPTDDQGLISVNIDAAQSTSIDAMRRYMDAAARVVAAHPAVDAVAASVGGGQSSGTNNGSLTVRLKDRNERGSAFDIANQLRAQLGSVVGIRAYPQVPATVRIGGVSSKALYQVALSGSDLPRLYQAADDFEQKLRALPELTDLNSDLQITSPQLKVEIQRERAAMLGISPADIETALYSAFGTQQVSTIYTATAQYYVILEVAPAFASDPAAIHGVHLRAAGGTLVPLDTVATVRTTVGPLNVGHIGQSPSVTLSFNLKPGASLGEATTAVARAAATLPSAITYTLLGTAQAFQQSLSNIGLLLVLAIFVIYVVLGILYEDFVHPLTILSGLPAAGFGALLTLWVFRQELNIMGYVGLVLLIGIVKKNAIMMIDFALSLEHREGANFSAEKAIYEACLTRFRPIMMTTFAALAGAVPIALSLGAGAESRRPLGLAVVGGLMVSQLLTLFLTPVLYVYMERFKAWMRSRGKQRAPQPAAASAH